MITNLPEESRFAAQGNAGHTTMTTPSNYEARVIEGLHAEFNQPSGPGRAGTDWAVTLSGHGDERRLLVRTFDDDFAGRSQEETLQAVLTYVGRLLESGYLPNQYRGGPGELVVGRAPSPSSVRAEAGLKKPWWRFW